MNHCTGAGKPRNPHHFFPKKEFCVKKYFGASPLRHCYHPPIPASHIGLPRYHPFRILLYTHIPLLGITLDEERDELFVNDRNTNKLFVYDLSGEFKRSFGNKKDIMYDMGIYNFDRDHLICQDGSLLNDGHSNRFLVVSKQDGSVTKEIQIPYKEKKTTLLLVRNTSGQIIFDAGARNKELIPYRDSWILVEPSSDTIYSYSADHSLKPFIVRTPSIQSMNPEVFLFPGVLTDRYYFLQTAKKEADIVAQTAFPRTDLVYDRQEKAIYEYAVYNSDFTNKKPMSLVYETPMFMLINSNEIAFAKRLEAPDLVEAYGKGELKGRLKEIAAGLDEESNAVIMLAKHKK
jgi:hypothetical protein